MDKLPLFINSIRTLRLGAVLKASSNMKYCRRSTIHFVQLRQAGHSHWDNIRHIKGAKDAEKSMITQQVAYKIRNAIRETGGSNPKINSKLAAVIKFAEKNNVPSKSIQSMITKAESIKQELATIEAKGPKGSLLIFDVSTPNVRKTRNDIGKILTKRCGGAVMTDGGTRNFFETKGVIVAKPKESLSISLEEATDIAIMVNADDVKTTECEDDSECFEVTCEPEIIYQVVKGLESTSLEVHDYNIVPIPRDLIELSDDDKQRIDTAIQALYTQADMVVEKIYDNIKW